MKYLIRKPLLPCMLLLFLVFGAWFLTLFRQNIQDEQAAVEEMYGSVQLTFQILPGVGDGGELKLRNTPAKAIQALNEVTSSAYYLICPYSLREPRALADLSVVYGTNDPSFFAEERSVEITYGEGWDEERLMTDSEEGIPCLLEVNLMAVLGLETGDIFVIAPNEGGQDDREAAPSITMVAAGTFQDTKGLTELYGLITPADLFSSNPGLLYTGAMMGTHYFYRAFQFETDPAYNRNYAGIRDSVMEILEDHGDFILYSNVRTLEQTVRPLEQKIRIQKLLLTPLSVIFCAAAAIVSALLALNLRTEVFLRLLWGEERTVVFFKIWGSVCVMLALWTLLAGAAAWLVSAFQWNDWASSHFAMAFVLCLSAPAIPLAAACRKNLVTFYQSMEE